MGGPNSGAKNRKKGDWLTVAAGRNQKSKLRTLRSIMRCPMNAAHLITGGEKGLINHLATHGGRR